MKDCCPNCGYCSHCGRGRQLAPQYPTWPYYYGQPFWQIPYTTGGIVYTPFVETPCAEQPNITVTYTTSTC